MEPLRKSSNAAAAAQERYTLSYTNPGDVMDHSENHTSQQAKKERTRQALLAMLPPYDKLNKIINTNSEWWATWRRKCSGTSSTDESLAQFASRALASGKWNAKHAKLINRLTRRVL